MMVAAPLPEPKVIKITRNTLAYLGYGVMVEGEETLDMLQGVLVVIACSDQAIYVMLQAARLLLIEIPDWDAQSARQALNLNDILVRMISRFEEAEKLRNAEAEAFAHYACDEEAASEMTGNLKLAKETRWLNRWFEARSQGYRVGDMLLAEFGEDEVQNIIRPSWSVGLLEEMPWNIG
ncbi:hypothetical protein F53441_166 [Fusarium austroafricanum]|uniref:Uncharacterized protein n=1 Tax=Fusarium austroafricanum TaxID=2364996 RepID=A0A8H4PEY1_9HYPO|nr:hypothetical protein F53441_166 [Fusarium austroafricanum]